ncbi:MAG TPA: hypothetical protein PKE20_00030 [Promineifilum sp.]|nr:hypothetical protein [Promineifilum sp.]
MTMLQRFNVYGGVTSIDRENHIIYGVSAMQAVEALGHRLMVDHTTLRQFVELGNAARNGLKSRFTHPGLSADGLGKHLGPMRNFRVVGDKAIGDLYLSESAARSPSGDLRAYVESLAAEDPESFGMSVVVDGKRVWVLNDGSEHPDDGSGKPADARDKYPTLRVVAAHAVDAVDEPAANRDGLFSVFRGTTSELAAAVYQALDRFNDGDFNRWLGPLFETGEIPAEFRQIADEYDIDADKARVFAAHYLEHRRRHNAPARITLAANAALTESNPMEDEILTTGAAQETAVAQQGNEWLTAMQQSATQAMIQASGLPAATQARLARGRYETPGAVEAAIADARAEQAALQEAQVIQVGGKAPRSYQVFDAQDEARSIVEWMFGVEGAATPAANMRSLSQLYVALTGDSEFRGLFDPARVMFGGATTATLPNLAVDAMNKVIMQQMVRMDHWRWYERVAVVEPNNGTLHDMKWITIGGLGALPIVAERAGYTELQPGDVKETSAFAKRGAYVGISREAIKNSDLQQIQAIPRGLANAAVRTRSAAVSALFTQASGTGPTLAQDSTVLFHSSHANVATTAFGTDATAWRAARSECFQHTELTSGAVLGIYPRFALLPAELYDTALSVFGYGDGMPTVYTPEAQDRGFADPRPIPLVVPDWTDATDWAYIVDPAVFPVIQMSYSQNPGGRSHPAPELFSVVSETSGLLFTNDTLPIKVRDEFAVGVNGPRGIGKRNVAG